MKTWVVQRDGKLIGMINAVDEKTALATCSGDSVVEVTAQNRAAFDAEYQAVLTKQNRPSVITKTEFLRRLGMKALADILENKDPVIAAWKCWFDSLPFDGVNLDDQETSDGLDALEAVSLLTKDVRERLVK